jgi:cytochrome c556
MLKGLITAVSVVALGCALAAPAAAQDAEHAVKARKGVLQAMAWHFGPLVAMARGDLDYDAERAARHAGMLQGLPAYLPELFIQGSSNAERDDTRALPVIWSDSAGFAEKHEALAVEIATLAAVAGDGHAAMAPQVVATGQACSACHDNYRAR